MKNSGQKTLIALLDNAEVLLEVLGEELRGNGYDVITFDHKDDFLSHLRLHPERVPDLVISDIKCPGMDGLQFLRRFTMGPNGHHVPVIILSGNIPDLEIEAKQLGAYECLSKPYDLQDLLGVIQEARQMHR